MEKKFSTFNFQLSTFQRGFTLIELLVVIAVLGVLAAGVLVAINPLQKIKQANDVRAKSDMGQIVQALQSYSVSHNGKYPLPTQTTNGLEALVPDELKRIPVKPTDFYDYKYIGIADTDGNVTAVLYTKIQVPQDPTMTVYCWDDTNGVFKEIVRAPANTATDCTAGVAPPAQ